MKKLLKHGLLCLSVLTLNQTLVHAEETVTETPVTNDQVVVEKADKTATVSPPITSEQATEEKTGETAVTEYLGEALYIPENTSGSYSKGQIVGYIDADGQLHDTSGKVSQEYNLGLWTVGGTSVLKHPTFAIDNDGQVVDKATSQVKGMLTDYTRYTIDNKGFVVDNLRSISSSLEGLVKYGSVVKAWESRYEKLPVTLPTLESTKQEDDSFLATSYQSEGILKSANFKTKESLKQFQSEVDALLKESGLYSPELTFYDPAGIRAAMNQLGYDEKLYQIEESAASYNFIASFPLGTQGGVAFFNRFESVEQWANEIGKDLLARANVAAAASWGVTTTSVFNSSSDPVTVQISNQDLGKIAGIISEKVTDSAVLDKLPSSFKPNNVTLYDIKLLDANQEVTQISDSAQVTIAIDKDRKVSKVIYFLPETGAVEELPFEVSEDKTKVTFSVSHFSNYGIIYEEQPTTPSEDNKPNDNLSGDKNLDKGLVDSQVNKQEIDTNVGIAKKNILPKTGEATSSLYMLAGLLVLLFTLALAKFHRSN